MFGVIKRLSAYDVEKCSRTKEPGGCVLRALFLLVYSVVGSFEKINIETYTFYNLHKIKASVKWGIIT